MNTMTMSGADKPVTAWVRKRHWRDGLLTHLCMTILPGACPGITTFTLAAEARGVIQALRDELPDGYIKRWFLYQWLKPLSELVRNTFDHAGPDARVVFHLRWFASQAAGTRFEFTYVEEGIGTDRFEVFTDFNLPSTKLESGVNAGGGRVSIITALRDILKCDPAIFNRQIDKPDAGVTEQVPWRLLGWAARNLNTKRYGLTYAGHGQLQKS